MFELLNFKNNYKKNFKNFLWTLQKALILASWGRNYISYLSLYMETAIYYKLNKKVIFTFICKY